MAYTATTTHHESSFDGLFTAIRNFFMTDSKLSQLDALWSLSDADLAKRGLERKDIGKVVFGVSAWN